MRSTFSNIKFFWTALVVFLLVFTPLFLFFISRPGSAPIPKNSSPLSPTTTQTPPTTLPLPSDMQRQFESEKNVANQMQNVQNQYPWINKLPLQSNNYFVYFDTNQKQMIGRIYTVSNNLSNSQVSSIKNDIVTQLTNLGVDVNKYPVVWQTNL